MSSQGYFANARPELVERVPAKAQRILDVGCGEGSLGAALKERQGAEVWGVEPVSGAARKAAERLDRVFNLPVEEALAELPAGSFDCIVTADVLEHIVDPWLVLRELRGRLAPGGCIVASVPNVGHWSVVRDLLAGSWNYTNDGLLDHTHLRFFTRGSVEELFWNSGLRISTLDGARYGEPAPAAVLTALERAGLEVDSLDRDGEVLQFLVTAHVASAPEPPLRVAVIVLGWNRREETLACLSSLAALDVPGLEVIAVDNGSTDGSADAVEAEFPDVRLVRNDRNLGYAGGNNRGLEAAEASGAAFALLLNNDARPETGMLEELVRVAALIPDAGFVGALAVMRDDPGRIWSAGGRWNPTTRRFAPLGWSEGTERVEHRSIRSVGYATGCALLVRMEAYRAVGGMDEDFFLTWEEADWAVRARELGWRSVVAPAARVRHGVSVSFGGGDSPLHRYFMVRNRLLFARRHLALSARWSTYLDTVADLWQNLLPAWRWKKGLRRNVRELQAWCRRLAGRSAAPGTRARWFALRDFALGRLGSGSEGIWRLNRSWEEASRLPK